MSFASINAPTLAQVTSWWEWAAGFSRPNDPFEIGGGQFINDRQPGAVYCLSCTGGFGGVDYIDRPLQTAIDSRNPILIPVFVAGADSLKNAQDELGNSPSVELMINDVQTTPLLRDFQIAAGINFVAGNPFNVDPPRRITPFFTVGYWATIPAADTARLKSVAFGGSGGRISEDLSRPFLTKVVYTT